jgi:hypothetical protein
LSPIATSLFTKDDILRGTGKDGVELIRQYELSRYGNDYTEEDLDWEIMLAIVDVATLRQRLAIFGYGQELFDTSIAEAIESTRESLSGANSDMKDYYKAELDVLKKLQSNKLPLKDISYKLLENLMIYDEMVVIWAVLQNPEIVDSDVAVIDLDDLVEGGWLDDELANTDSDYLLSEGHFVPELPIIITEGVSDERFLQKSLEVIYPKLVSNVRFLDSDFKPERSASSAIKLVKSFASAGISNRILVILDNDAAASDAMKDIPISLPKNIKIIQYPMLEWLKKYPTIGAQGEVEMDINGLAGSIEMYLGKDTLTDKSGKLVRVQWQGYMSRVKKYQGSLLDKGGVQDRFNDKDENDPSKWSDLKSVWDYIIEQLSTF